MRGALTLFLLLSASLFPSDLNSRADSIGLKRIYDLQFDSAKSIYNRLIAEDSLYFEGYYRLAQIYLWSFMGTGRQEFLPRFDRCFEKALAVFEAETENKDASARQYYILGRLYQFKATINSINSDLIPAFLNTRNSIQFFENALETDTGYYRAYFGLGTFNYALSFVPGLFSWVLDLTGLESDKEKGLNLIRLAYHRKNSETPEIAYYLSKIYMDYIAEYDSAYRILKGLTEEFPSNTLFNYQLAVLYIKTRRLDLAEESLNRLIGQGPPEFQQTENLARFLLGEIYYKRNQFDKAAKFYGDFIDRTESIDYSGIANLKLAFCYHFLNDETEFKRHLLLARNGNLDIYEDLSAKRKSERLFDRGITREDEILIKAENLLEAGRAIESNEMLEGKYSSDESSFKRKTLKIKAEAFYLMSNIDSARLYCTEILELKGSEGSFEYYFAGLLLARILFAENSRESAGKYLRISEGYKELENFYELEPYYNNLDRKLKMLEIKQN